MRSPLAAGDELVFDDMAHYTMVKTTFFNGVRHPDIAVQRKDGSVETVRRFTYEDFEALPGLEHLTRQIDMAAAKEGIKQKVRGWSHHDSADLYGIDDWGNGYFRINKKGEVTVRLNDEDGGKKDISLCDLLEGLKERGTTVPVLFRFRDLLRSRIAELNDSFRKAIKEADYQGKYQGVYPIKVNQQRQVVEEIAEFGTKYDYGLEAGSKPELIAAMAHMHNRMPILICNGYKMTSSLSLR